MRVDRRFVRGTVPALLFLGLLSLAWFLSAGAVKTALFMVLATSGIAFSVAVWPEILVMAYLFAGRYGYEARLAPGDLPISLNQMMLVGLLLIALLNGRFLLRSARRWSSLGLLMFSLALVLGLGWTLGINYGLYKVTRTWLVVVPAVLMAGTLVAAWPSRKKAVSRVAPAATAAK